MTSAIVLNFFPAITPPISGGETRLDKLYRALSRWNDITIVASTEFGTPYEQILHTPRLREIRFPMDGLWKAAYSALERSGLQGELSGLAFAMAVSDPSCELRQRALVLAQSADVVIHEFPFSEPIFADGCPCREIYNSHHFEVGRLSSIVRGNGFEDALLKLIRLEGNLVARSQRVFATSWEEAEKFRLFYGADTPKVGICPNGIDPQELMPIVAARQKRARTIEAIPKLFFIGSAHYGNVEAAEYLVNSAHELSDCEIVLAGSVCTAVINQTRPGNVTLLGVIDAMAKNRLLSEVDLFVNPVVLGSCNSLKALEALGAAVPMVSTPEGVRGLKLEPGVHCAVVVRNHFIDTVRRILDDAGKRGRIAAAGVALAHEQYSWARIAANFSAQLASSAAEASRCSEKTVRSLLLALNDYPVLQPGSGGAARIRGLLTHVDCDVVLLSFGVTFEVGLIALGFLHATIPKTAAHRAFQDAMNDGQPVSVNDGVASLFAGSNQVLTELARSLACRAGAVVFEHPYMAPVLDAISTVRPGLPVIYSSHNVEATHKQELLHGHRLATTLVPFIAELERRLVEHANLLVCCTDADAAHFASANVKSVIVANGCSLPSDTVLAAGRRRAQEGGHSRIGFVGSSHRPNVDAAIFIVSELAPPMPVVLFELIGSVCSHLTPPVPRNVVLHGVLDEASKTLIMAGWDVALNPVQSGGGSSVKLPDYMAHTLATLSTPAGARGFAVEEHDAGQVVERGQFLNVLGTMLANQEAILRQQANARRYATCHLTWDAITVPYRQALNRLLKPPSV